MSSKTEKMTRFICDFRTLRSAKQVERLERMTAFLSKFEKVYWQSPGLRDFNVFYLLNIRWDEVRHSRFLVWLLDPKAGHGQGSRFFQAFSELCGLDLPPEVLERYRVRTELPSDESIIDITVYRRGEFLIYLENKVLALESRDQIGREFRDMRQRGRALCVPEERQFAVFLTPTGRSPTSGSATYWHAISYPQIAASFGKLLPGIASDKVKIILSDWLDTISTFGGYDEHIL